MKRVNGWDALMLYSERPNVHQHTLKVAVIDISQFAGKPTVEVLRETLHRRLHLLEPLRYQLIDVPLHLHRPMWRERVEVDLDYHMRPIQVPAPGGRRELDHLPATSPARLSTAAGPCGRCISPKGWPVHASP